MVKALGKAKFQRTEMSDSIEMYDAGSEISMTNEDMQSEEDANSFQLSTTDRAHRDILRWRKWKGNLDQGAYYEEPMNLSTPKDQSPTIDTTTALDEDTTYDDLPELVSDTPQSTPDDSSDEEQETSVQIHDISPTRCCSTGSRRFILHADTEFPLSEENSVEPRLIVMDPQGAQSEEKTSQWLRQPTEWRLGRRTMWLWVGCQDNEKIQEIEEEGGSVWLYLKDRLTGETSAKWRITIDLCRRQKQPQQDCLYCCRQTLNFLDGSVWTEGEVSSPAGQTSYDYEPAETGDAARELTLAEEIEKINLEASELETQEDRFNRFVFLQISKIIN